jgi:uncharacterized protein YdhG (YjbR/CyaY superfamily)
MTPLRSQIKTIDEYIAKSPRDVRDILEQLRQVIRDSAPQSEEAISYGMPAFKLNSKTLVYFAAHKNHIGFYPTSSPIEVFRQELTPYKHSKGAVQFPLDRPIPFDLVRKMVKFRVEEIESEKR